MKGMLTLDPKRRLTAGNYILFYLIIFYTYVPTHMFLSVYILLVGCLFLLQFIFLAARLCWCSVEQALNHPWILYEDSQKLMSR